MTNTELSVDLRPHDVLLDAVWRSVRPLRVLTPASPYPAPPAEQSGVASLDGAGQHVADVGQEQHHQGQAEHGVDHAEQLATAGPGRDVTVAWQGLSRPDTPAVIQTYHSQGRHREQNGIWSSPLVGVRPVGPVKLVVGGHLDQELGQLVDVGLHLLLVETPDHPDADTEVGVVLAGRAGRGEAVVVRPDLGPPEVLAAVVQPVYPGPGNDQTVRLNNPHLS